MSEAQFTDQATKLVAENRRLRIKSDVDDETINILKQQYDELQSGVENLIEDHRKIERQLCAERDRAVRTSAEIEALLTQAGDLILQAMRARIGDVTPKVMPKAQTPHLVDQRMPQVLLS